MKQAKTTLTDLVRQALLSTVPNIQETDRANASLIDLSFQSTAYPEQHIWLGVYGRVSAIDPEESEEWDGSREIHIDLEDWLHSDEWDNSVAHHQTLSIEEAVQIINRWINKLD